MSGKKWSTANTLLSVVGGICGLVGIFTSIKASAYEEEQQYLNLEERYGLTPVNKEETD